MYVESYEDCGEDGECYYWEDYWAWNVRDTSGGEISHYTLRNETNWCDFGEDEDYCDGSYSESTGSASIRPIVTLKAGINFISGNGTEGSPWKVN